MIFWYGLCNVFNTKMDIFFAESYIANIQNLRYAKKIGIDACI